MEKTKRKKSLKKALNFRIGKKEQGFYLNLQESARANNRKLNGEILSLLYSEMDMKPPKEAFNPRGGTVNVPIDLYNKIEDATPDLRNVSSYAKELIFNALEKKKQRAVVQDSFKNAGIEPEEIAKWLEFISTVRGTGVTLEQLKENLSGL